MKNPITALRTNLRQRGALIATGLFGSRSVVRTTYGRGKNVVAPVDLWNVDYWFDGAAISILDWYMSDEPMGHVSFIGTEWEDEAHFPDGKGDGVEPVWDKAAADRILRDLRDELALDPFSAFDDVDFDCLGDGEMEAAWAEEARLEERKQRARMRFTALLPALWD